ncbi:SDR family NAD(P)-dependent oxidoreductase [Sorangium sp. So ce1014]|uniref:SDR family NAD(P)-dependent oxidoreductase n=1 Tax=Sorangium sp. So ce1014 TaxID=3133326 RepID=UPI003F622A9F
MIGAPGCDLRLHHRPANGRAGSSGGADRQERHHRPGPRLQGRAAHRAEGAAANERRGSIIRNASISSSQGKPGLSVYCASKAAVRSFTRTWSVDLKGRNIRVNATAPASS